jgi:glucose-6-phosphate 1-dehydrogenase
MEFDGSKVPGPVWGDTTFYLTAGKGLDKKESIIKISYRKEHFKAVLTCVRDIVSTVRSDVDFLNGDISCLESLALVLQIQPKPVRNLFSNLFFIFL